MNNDDDTTFNMKTTAKMGNTILLLVNFNWTSFIKKIEANMLMV